MTWSSLRYLPGQIALALAIVALEWLGWWPDALTLDHGRGGGALRP